MKKNFFVEALLKNKKNDLEFINKHFERIRLGYSSIIINGKISYEKIKFIENTLKPHIFISDGK